tara:strand:- start:31296 stop:31520 length:225 start_codon:yes stop_codon:yes gene_type:complete
MWAKNSDYRVTGHQNLKKDGTTGAIVNTNKEAYDAYLRQKEAAVRSINNTEDIKRLQDEISEIKSLLKDLVSKL